MRIHLLGESEPNAILQHFCGFKLDFSPVLFLRLFKAIKICFFPFWYHRNLAVCCRRRIANRADCHLFRSAHGEINWAPTVVKVWVSVCLAWSRCSLSPPCYAFWDRFDILNARGIFLYIGYIYYSFLGLMHFSIAFLFVKKTRKHFIWVKFTYA